MADAFHANLCTVKRLCSSEHRSTHHTAQETNIESERSGKLIDGCKITTEALMLMLVNNQLDALFSKCIYFYFFTSTCFEQQVLIIRRFSLYQYKKYD